MQQQMQMQQQMKKKQQLDRQRQAQDQQLKSLQQLLEVSPGEVRTPEGNSIDYVYDPFGESIFATPQQEALFTDPFTQRSATAQRGIAGALGGRR